MPVRSIPQDAPIRVVGDVHGDAVAFGYAAATDRFVVQLGDLTDYGPDNAGTLRMMANWDLAGLKRDLPKLRTPLFLLTGMKDGTVDPERAHDVRKLVPGAEMMPFPGLGHLAHEEQPALFARRIHDIAQRFEPGDA